MGFSAKIHFVQDSDFVPRDLDVQPDVRAASRNVSRSWKAGLACTECRHADLFLSHRNRMTIDRRFILDLIDQVPRMRMLVDLSHILLSRGF